MTDHTTEKQRAFERQALIHKEMLYQLGMRMTRNAEEADYLVKLTYLKADVHWEKYEQGTNILSWLYRIMKNAFVMMYYRKLEEQDTAGPGVRMRRISRRPVTADMT
jgi:RNA polymerase sigma-70 factor (ECF subfamily)